MSERHRKADWQVHSFFLFLFLDETAKQNSVWLKKKKIIWKCDFLPDSLLFFNVEESEILKLWFPQQL